MFDGRFLNLASMVVSGGICLVDMGELRVKRDEIVRNLDTQRREVEDIGFRIGRLFGGVLDVEETEKELWMHMERLDEMKHEYVVVRDEYYGDVVVEMSDEADESREKINEACLAPVVVKENRLYGIRYGMKRVVRGWFEELGDARKVKEIEERYVKMEEGEDWLGYHH